jgi:hypothetical protein
MTVRRQLLLARSGRWRTSRHDRLHYDAHVYFDIDDRRNQWILPCYAAIFAAESLTYGRHPMVRLPRRPALKPPSDREMTILRSFQSVRLLTAAHVQRLHVEDGPPLTRLRHGQHALRQLFLCGLVTRMPRVLSRRRAGHAGFVYALSGRGRQVLSGLGVRVQSPATWRATARFQEHMLLVSDLYVQLREEARQEPRNVKLVSFASEPGCWRHFSGASGPVVLKPDAFVCINIERWTSHAFIEIDRGGESLPTIRRKCERYVAYWQSGVVQQRSRSVSLPHGLFPYVVWLVPGDKRKQDIQRVIQRLPEDARRLFKAGLLEHGAEMLVALTAEGTRSSDRAPP